MAADILDTVKHIFIEKLQLILIADVSVIFLCLKKLEDSSKGIMQLSKGQCS